MRFRNLLTLALGLVLGAIATFMAWDRIEHARGPIAVVQQQPQMQVTKIVVARTNLYFGNRLSAEQLREVDWPEGSIPEGAFKSIGEVINTEKPRTVLRTIEVNEPILASKISGAGEKATLSAVIDGTMRAMTIRVNDVIGVAGFVVPGDRVDVLLTRQEVGASTPITDILLQNVKVLGIDQISNDSQEKPVVAQAVTLELSPDQAQKVTLGAQVGQLSLALRNLLDSVATSARTIGVPDLRVGEVNNPGEPLKTKDAPKIARVKKPEVDPRASVKIFRGMDSSEYKVESDQSGGSVPLGGIQVQPKSKGAAPAAPAPAAPAAPAEKAPTPIVPKATPEVSAELPGASQSGDNGI